MSYTSDLILSNVSVNDIEISNNVIDATYVFHHSIKGCTFEILKKIFKCYFKCYSIIIGIIPATAFIIFKKSPPTFFLQYINICIDLLK